jgi:hypothetical protein
VDHHGGADPIDALSFLPDPLITDEQLAFLGAVSAQGFLAAVFLGMLFMMVWGSIAEKEWKEIALRLFLLAVGFLGYLLSGITNLNLTQAVAVPLSEMGHDPYRWATGVPAAAGLTLSFLLMRAVKSRGRRPIRGILLIGPAVLLFFGQLVLPTMLQLAVLDLTVLLPGVGFCAGLIFYVAFVEDWRRTRFGFIHRFGRLFRRRKQLQVTDHQD